MNSAQFLDKVKARHALTSDYQVAKYLGLSPNRISMYRRGKREFDELTCMKVAHALDEHALYVMASIQGERAKDSEVKRVWLECAKIGKKAKAFVLSILIAVIGFGGAPEIAQAAVNDNGREYTLHASILRPLTICRSLGASR